MKSIGMLGGMSWESSTEYYRFLNRAMRERLGGFHSARIFMSSVDFAPVEEAMRSDRWDLVSETMVDEALRLQAAGADFLILATNSVHHIAPSIESALAIPFLHIGDSTAEAIKNAGFQKVGLLGTRFTMEKPFLRDRLRSQGIETLVPEQADRDEVHRVVFEELVQGKFLPSSRVGYLEIFERLRDRGAEGIVLGCTEIGMLVKPEDSSMPMFDTALIHCQAAVKVALE